MTYVHVHDPNVLYTCQVLIMEPATPPEVSTAMATNHSMAVHTSLLILPETFTREQLYTVIAGLSYQGEHLWCDCLVTGNATLCLSSHSIANVHQFSKFLHDLTNQNLVRQIYRTRFPKVLASLICKWNSCDLTFKIMSTMNSQSLRLHKTYSISMAWQTLSENDQLSSTVYVCDVVQ